MQSLNKIVGAIGEKISKFYAVPEVALKKKNLEKGLIVKKTAYRNRTCLPSDNFNKIATMIALLKNKN